MIIVSKINMRKNIEQGLYRRHWDNQGINKVLHNRKYSNHKISLSMLRQQIQIFTKMVILGRIHLIFGNLKIKTKTKWYHILGNPSVYTILWIQILFGSAKNKNKTKFRPKTFNINQYFHNSLTKAKLKRKMQEFGLENIKH
jgi:hypothetical protein